MDAKNNLFTGFWRLYFENESVVLSGTLDVDSRSLHCYCDIPYYLENEQKFTRGDIDNITGQTVDSYHCTLYGCFFKNITIQGSNIAVFEVSLNFVFIGGHLQSKSQQLFDSVGIELSSFDNLSVDVMDELEHVEQYGDVCFVKRVLPSGKKRTLCRIRFLEKCDIDAVLMVVYEVRCLFTFVRCKAINVLFLEVGAVGFDNFIFLDNKMFRMSTCSNYFHESWPVHVGNEAIGYNLFSRWASFFRKHKNQIECMETILSSPSVSCEDDLAKCLHAIEGFYGFLLGAGVEFQPVEIHEGLFVYLCSHLRLYVQWFCLDKSFLDLFRKTISHVRNKTLRCKLIDLIDSHLDAEYAQNFVTERNGHGQLDAKKYSQIMVGIRNHASHLDGPVSEEVRYVLNSPVVVYNYKVSAFSFLYTLLCKNFFEIDSHAKYRLSRVVTLPYTGKFYAEKIRP